MVVLVVEVLGGVALYFINSHCWNLPRLCWWGDPVDTSSGGGQGTPSIFNSPAQQQLEESPLEAVVKVH